MASFTICPQEFPVPPHYQGTNLLCSLSSLPLKSFAIFLAAQAGLDCQETQDKESRFDSESSLSAVSQ